MQAAGDRAGYNERAGRKLVTRVTLCNGKLSWGKTLIAAWESTRSVSRVRIGAQRVLVMGRFGCLLMVHGSCKAVSAQTFGGTPTDRASGCGRCFSLQAATR
jgi:hypothetical protein